MPDKQLLIVANTPSANTRVLLEAVKRGASHPDVTGVQVTASTPLDARADHVLRSDALIIGSTENFGYMSGLIKDFFERIYYPCLEEKQGLPYALYVKAGLDGTGTINGIEKIITGLRWKRSHDTVLLHGEYKQEFAQRCEELGTYMAASLEAGII